LTRSVTLNEQISINITAPSDASTTNILYSLSLIYNSEVLNTVTFSYP
jgi:hypothetical protein